MATIKASKRNFSAPRGSMGNHPTHGIYDTPSTQGLFLAGDYTRLPALNGAIKSGIEAAEASLSYIGDFGE